MAGSHVLLRAKWMTQRKAANRVSAAPSSTLPATSFRAPHGSAIPTRVRNGRNGTPYTSMQPHHDRSLQQRRNSTQHVKKEAINTQTSSASVAAGPQAIAQHGCTVHHNCTQHAMAARIASRTPAGLSTRLAPSSLKSGGSRILSKGMPYYISK
jgi:hypothetical protein